MSPLREPVSRQSLLFREVNQRVAELSDPWPEGDVREFLCECGDPDCTETVAVTRSDYAVAREDPCRFLLASTHIGEDMAVRVSRDGYVIVEWRETQIGAARRR